MRQEKNTPHKKGFTLIELMTVLTILAILVLMATPRFLERTEKALEISIRNNVMLVESKVAETLILDQTRINDWITIPVNTLMEQQANENLFDRRGEVNGDNPLRGTEYRIIPPTFVSQEARGGRDGTYYTNENGVIYYTEE